MTELQKPPSEIPESPSLYSSGSKSCSSKSISSEVPKDLDFTKDNVMSPIDLECQIQAQRVTKVLDEAILKTKLAISLPELVQEYNLLHDTLSMEHMDDLLFIFEQYENPQLSSNLLNFKAMLDIRSGDLSLTDRLNPKLAHLVYIMNRYPALKPKAEQIVEKMVSDYERDSTQTHPVNPSVEYLLALIQFRNQVASQMSTTAAEELTAKFDNRKREQSNNKLTEQILELTITLKKEQEDFEEEIDQKGHVIAKLEQDISLLTHEANIKLKKKILDSERQMVLATRSHAVRYEMLKEEKIDSRDAYEHSLDQDIKDEKSQRARRFKVETQLLSWLQKYDLEMGEKQAEFDEMSELYEEEVRRTKECEAKLEEQDKQYIPLMEERENEYQQEMMEKMTKFLHEHAARVIQTAWRDVLKNRAEKKKLQVLVRKMKERQAAAARAAEIAAKKQEEADRKAAKAQKLAAKAAK